MAKYTVKMSCGHEETVELFGKASDRERKIKYYEKSTDGTGKSMERKSTVRFTLTAIK